MKTEFKIPWMAVVARPRSELAPAEARSCHGDGYDILLQGFHWASHAGALDRGTQRRKSWYQIVRENAAAIKAAGFTCMWFPPPSESLAVEGYIPRRWNVLDTPYGAEADLRTAIAELEPVKALADLVLNHRVGVATSGADFADPAFPDNRAAIARDDESGVGTGNPDTGERHPAGRDLDHTNPDVRAAIINYMGTLQAVGFKGWRYDLVKGYHGRFVGEYNEATAPYLSVGEYFDGDRQRLTDWIDATGGKSTAFDFATRFLLYEACRSDDYARLSSTNCGRVVPGGLLGFWPSRAVTFVDNHDTEYRRNQHDYSENGAQHFPGAMVDLAHAYILTHPGIPCIFWSHYFDWGTQTRQQIDRLIQVRKQAGLHANSVVQIKEATRGLYAAIIDYRVAVKLGSRDWFPGSGWQLAVHGERFAVWRRHG